MKYIDTILNKFTMYKVVLYALCALVLYAFIVDFSIDKVISLVVLMFGSYILNEVIAKILKAPTNAESSVISGLILFLILAPYASIQTLCSVVVLSTLSKYILAWKKRHIFNPVAITVALAVLVGIADFTWWIGGRLYIIPVLIIGLLVVRKVRRFSLFIPFVFVSTIIALVKGISLSDFFISGPVIFFGAFMLTEPASTPPNKKTQVIYAIIVGLLYNFFFEYALVLGNVFSYIVSPKEYIILKIKEKTKIANGIWEYVFDGNVSHIPGQYAEWTLAHKADTRGSRRYFTIASAPTETLRIGIREGVSSFKKSLDIGHSIVISQVGGEFILPKDPNKKLVFIAGGIGVTPFRSMVKHLIDTKEKRDIVLLYAASDPTMFAYKDIFSAYNMKTEYVSMITKDMLTPYTDRMFYISGPNAMVDVYKKMLKEMGVKDIITDYFPGF